MKARIEIKNPRARFEYEILDVFTAGMVLTGSEIKSLRASKASIKEAFAYHTKENELYIKNMHITEYEKGAYANHEPLRERKLLLSRHELDKIAKELKVQGITLVPLRVFISEKGWAKVDIALARGKKLFDKRESIKQKDITKELGRRLK
jgi:SsrA-binding protein